MQKCIRTFENNKTHQGKNLTMKIKNIKQLLCAINNKKVGSGPARKRSKVREQRKEGN